MGLKRTSNVGGFIHSLETIEGLSDEQCNLRLISDQTLYVLQNLSSEDITFLTRYAVSFEPGDLYEPVLPGTPESATVYTTIDIIRRDLSDMNCDIVGAINSLAQVIAANACGCPVGQGEDTEDGEEGGAIPSPVGDIVYEEPSTAPDRECKAANLIHDTLFDTFVQLDAYNVDDMSVLGLSLAVGVVAGIIASAVVTPMGGVLVAVAGSLAVFVARMLGVTVSLGDIVTAMTDRHGDLVCTLFNSTSASGAKSAYLAILLEEVGISSIEADLVGLLMTNALMNVLFFDTAETVDFWPSYTGSIDCTSCVTLPTDWVFIPNGRFNMIATAAGTLGTGAIDNGGGVWTATATQRNDGANTHWCVGLCTQAFLDAHPGTSTMSSSPAGSGDGTYTRHTPSPPLSATNFGKTSFGPGCITVSTITDFATTPTTQDDFQMMYFQSANVFTLDFSYPASPIVC